MCDPSGITNPSNTPPDVGEGEGVRVRGRGRGRSKMKAAFYMTNPVKYETQLCL